MGTAEAACCSCVQTLQKALLCTFACCARRLVSAFCQLLLPLMAEPQYPSLPLYVEAASAFGHHTSRHVIAWNLFLRPTVFQVDT